MSSPSLIDALKHLSKEEQKGLLAKLPPVHASLTEILERESAQLGFFSLYSAPAGFLSEKLAAKKGRREVFWILLFLLLWQEKGHTTFPLSAWENWVSDNLKEQEKLLLAHSARREFWGEFKEIADGILKTVGSQEKLKGVLKEHPRLVSQNLKTSSLLFWDTEAESLIFTKWNEKETQFLRTFSQALERPISSSLNLDSQESVLRDLQSHLAPFALSPEQENVVRESLKSPFLLLSGGPGTGKTTTVVSLLRAFIALWNAEAPPRIALCAPTGLASMRLKNSLAEALANPFIWQDKEIDDLIPREPKILQSLLGLGFRNPPKFNKSRSLPFDLILVDESSMIDLALAQNLLDALAPTARLILVGDPNQLPPVDMGAPFAGLVESAEKGNPKQTSSLAKLTQNFRFSASKSLGNLSKFLLAGESGSFQKTLENLTENDPIQFKIPDKPYSLASELYASFWLGKESSETISKCVSSVLKNAPYYLGQKGGADPKELLEPLNRSIILSSQNVGAWGIIRLNEYLAEEHRKQLRTLYKSSAKTPLLGAPLMVTQNRPDLGVVNGERGLIFYPEAENPIPYACFFQEGKWQNFPLSSLGDDWNLSFCSTIHKSQGSEYAHVVLILAEESPLLSRELLYTGLTRTKGTLDLYSSPEILKKAVSSSSARSSSLARGLASL